MAKASALRTSVRRTSVHPPELLSVQQAWSKMGQISWQGQMRAAPTLDLVTALRLAQAQAPMLWPTPTAAIGWATAAGMEAPGVAAAMVVAVVTVRVATPTTAAEETVEAEEARLVEVVAREAVRILDEAAGAVAVHQQQGRWLCISSSVITALTDLVSCCAPAALFTEAGKGRVAMRATSFKPRVTYARRTEASCLVSAAASAAAIAAVRA